MPVSLRPMTDAEFPGWRKHQVSLDVAGGNEVARALYESLGYRAISTAMTKTIGETAQKS